MSKSLGEYLYSKGIINNEQIQCALDHQAENKDKKIAEILVEINAVEDEQLLKELAQYLRVNHVILTDKNTNFIKAHDFTNKKEMLKYVFAPFYLDKEKLHVAISDINDRAVKEKIQGFHPNYKIEYYLCFGNMIKKYVNDSFAIDFAKDETFWKKNRLGEYLIQKGLINQTQLESILNSQKEFLDKKVGELLCEMKMVDNSSMLKELATYLDVPFEPLTNPKPVEVLMNYFDIDFMRNNSFVPFGQQLYTVRIAIKNINDFELKEIIENKLKAANICPKFYLALDSAIQNYIDKYETM